jgi:hypothetical protein
VHAARAFYRLYGDVFRSLPLPEAASGAAGMKACRMKTPRCACC